MKKHITLLSGLLVVSCAFGQVKPNIPVQSAKKLNTLRTDKMVASNSVSDEKAEGDILWSNNFTNATNWVPSAVNGSTGTDFGWQIGTAPNQITTWAFGTNTGNFTGGGAYAGCENGNPNTPTHDTDAEWILTFDSIFDFSGQTDLLFQFQEYGALFTEVHAVEVSLNGGSTWFEIGNDADLGMVTSGGGTAFANPTNRSYSVNAAVGALSNNMKFRFRCYWPSSNGAGIMYGWFVDNVKLVAGYANDVKLMETYSYTGALGVQYSKFPLSQVSATAVTEFSGVTKNIGSASQDVVLTVTGPNAYNEAGAPLTIVGYDSDSVFVPAANGYVIPATVGTGTLTYTLSSQNTLSNTTDDVKTRAFEVTNSVMAIDAYTNAASIISSFTGWASGSGDPAIGTFIEVFNEDEAGAINIGIANIGSTQQAPYLDRSFFGQLHKYNANTDEYEFFAQTEPHELIANDFGKIVPTYFNTPVTLTPGEYLLTAGMYEDAEVPIAMSGFVPQGQVAGFNGATLSGLAGNEAYISQVEAPVVRLDFKDYTAVNEIEALSNVSVFPNPFNNETTISFNLKNNAEVSLIVTDMTGRTVYTVASENMTAGEQVIAIDGSAFKAGIYNYTLSVDGKTTTNRIVKK